MCTSEDGVPALAHRLPTAGLDSARPAVELVHEPMSEI